MNNSLCASLNSSDVESTNKFSLKSILSPGCYILDHFLLKIHVAAASLKGRKEIISRRSNPGNKDNKSLLSLAMVMVVFLFFVKPMIMVLDMKTKLIYKYGF